MYYEEFDFADARSEAVDDAATAARAALEDMGIDTSSMNAADVMSCFDTCTDDYYAGV